MQSLALEIVHICSLIQSSFGIFCERHFQTYKSATFNLIFILFYIFKQTKTFETK